MANDKKGGAQGASADTSNAGDTTVDPKVAEMAARIADLEAQLAAAKTAPAPAPAPSGALRAKHNLAIAIGGERKDIAAGEMFEAPAEALSGLKLGEHYEAATK